MDPHDVLPIPGLLNALSAAFVVYDGHRRGRIVPLAAVVTLLVPFPLGLIGWFIFRPSCVQSA